MSKSPAPIGEGRLHTTDFAPCRRETSRFTGATEEPVDSTISGVTTDASSATLSQVVGQGGDGGGARGVDDDLRPQAIVGALAEERDVHDIVVEFREPVEDPTRLVEVPRLAVAERENAPGAGYVGGRVFHLRCIQSHCAGYWRMSSSSRA